MFLPWHVAECLNALERAGYSAYVVGGCVRDACLGLTPHDYDICTSALPEETEAVFSQRKLGLEGKKHGTIVVHTEQEPLEITTYRTEGAYSDNRHPDWVAFVKEVEKDLARRDFTVNAMAYSPVRGFADPFGGREDLKYGILRAVGDAETRFREDSLRILRGMRFAARFRLRVAPETAVAMEDLAHLTENLARERVFEELCKLLTYAVPEDILRFAPVLTVVIPELKPMLGFDQHSPHHAYDLYTHTAHVVAGVPGQPVLRWAALLHDLGKVEAFVLDEEGCGHFRGHAAISGEKADAVLRRLKAPTELRQEATTLIENHMTRLQEDEIILKRWIIRLGWDMLEDLLLLQEADMGSKGTGSGEDMDQFRRLRILLDGIRQKKPCLNLKDLALKGGDLIALGYSGKAVGQTLNRLLELVLEEKCENTRPGLLAALEAGE